MSYSEARTAKIRDLEAEKEALWESGKGQGGLVMLTPEQSIQYEELKQEIAELKAGREMGVDVRPASTNRTDPPA